MDKKSAYEAFAEYARSFDNSDIKIRLKIKHMYRVADLSQEIAKAEGADPELAWLIGLLHDIGRFQQVARYGTFVDKDSCDHARLSEQILFEDGLISKFTQGNHEIIQSAVAHHSAYKLPENLPADSLLYSKILRDADKLDIFRVMNETPLEDIYNVTSAQLYNCSVTPEVKQCFREGHAVLRALKKTPIDHLVGHICLFFELEFPKSISIAKAEGYLDQMLQFESRCQDTLDWFKYMRENI